MDKIVICDLVNEIIKRLIERRKFLKISQIDLAKKIGISRSKMIRIENGTTDLTIEEYLKCCIVLDLEPFSI